ncbi:MAG: hypothetical protein AUI10_02675 [Actinobacteria bacterium 13_2_20CM_2_72_6]|nr:MAG: hypothetical protein AUI10_02675 [Actinobacteria bacterium 13_2_20CM_2_72_6]
MPQPEGLQAAKVGVRLARQPDDLGEWLADGSAFEAAGADALWIDPGLDSPLDPLALTAALAAVTFRSLLITTLSASGRSSPVLARTLATIGRLSRGRLGILAGADSVGILSEVGPDMRVFRRIPGDPDAVEHARGSDPVERWVHVSCPDGRVAWRATLLDATERGFRGLLVPAEPRLLDILRNPDDPGYRYDLRLAQG